MSTEANTAIAWTIAGSDSGGGAGIQADLASFRDLGVHGGSVITAVTAQNSVAMSASEAVSSEQVLRQIEALAADLPAAAIKLGMLPNRDTVTSVANFLAQYRGPVVCDPVMCASSGAGLMERDAIDVLIAMLPRIDLLTPNIDEAQALSGVNIDRIENFVPAARRLLDMGARSVLITGGHLVGEEDRCLDYWSDGQESFFLSGERLHSRHTHGSGCTLSSAIAALLARGFDMRDALVLARAYVTAGIRAARGVGAGPGPVAHPGWPQALADWPGLSRDWLPAPGGGFPRCEPLGLYAVVDDVAWLERLLPLGVRTVQLRIKQGSPDALRMQIERAVSLGRAYDAQLFINDHWRLAIECGAYGVHLGQEDLDTADLTALSAAGLRLGISTHSDYEIARAHHLRPSYIALGPIYATTTKKMSFAPQGLERLARWVALLGGAYPLTAIGGIDAERAAGVLATGVGSCAVVRAITEAPDVDSRVADLLALHRREAGRVP